MKQSDIFSIIVVASVGTLAAFFICQSVIGKPEDQKVLFTGLRNVINSNLVAPEPEIFNATAINPTIEVYVGECEDLDKNGMLDEQELNVCHGLANVTDTQTDEQVSEGE